MTDKPKRLSTEDLHKAISESLGLVSLIKAGRGNLGGTTCLAPLAELSIRKGRKILLADGDVRNPGISQFEKLYKQYGLERPDNEEAGVLKEWFANGFNGCVRLVVWSWKRPGPRALFHAADAIWVTFCQSVKAAALAIR